MLPVMSRRPTNWPENADFMDREFGRMLRRFWEDAGNGREATATAYYPVNMWEDDESIHVEAEMPGFKRDDINVTIEQGMLSISAERGQRESQKQQEGDSLLNERRFVRYHRTFTLPNTVDDTNVNAHLEDGVLHLTMPKKAEVKPRKIEVK